jgi:hypothetical protein
MATAALLVAALVVAHGGAGLARTLAEVDDGSYCCCPSPEECRCTANCCSHEPAGARPDAAERDQGPTVSASISCHFPNLPDGSLSGTAGPDLQPATAAHRGRDQSPPDSSRRLGAFGVSHRPDSLLWAASPRAPPARLPAWC